MGTFALGLEPFGLHRARATPARGSARAKAASQPARSIASTKWSSKPNGVARDCPPTGLAFLSTGVHGAAIRPRTSIVARDAPGESGEVAEVTDKEEKAAPKDKIRTTLDDLNAILGIDEEEEKRKEKEAEERLQNRERKDERKDSEPLNASVSMDVLEKILKADNERGGLSDEAMKEIKEEIAKGKGGSDNPEGEEQLRKEFENLIEVLKPGAGIDKTDVKFIKDKVFGPNTFFVTDVRPNEALEGGSFFRGNMRTKDKTKVFTETLEALRAEFGDKYELFMVEDPEAFEEMEFGAEPRIAFLLMPSAVAVPPPVTGWQIAVAVLCAGLTFGSAAQLGLVTGVSRLPPEMLTYFSDPSNVDTDFLPPGLEDFDVVGYFESILPVVYAVCGVGLVHEAGHQAAGLAKGVKMGLPFFIPNAEIGSFGAITQFRSLMNNREAMFDVSVAGPLAGLAASTAVFAYGLAQTTGGDAGSLIPIPAQLFDGSLFLGGVCKAVLGEAAMSGKEVLIHPLVVAGWCAITTQAFSLLPIGALDGGRITQSAFGKGALAFTSLLCYIGLGLGLLGSSLALPFGLLVLLTQRVPERYIRDTITPVDEKRSYLAAALVVFAFFVLLPSFPESADMLKDAGGMDGAPFL